MLQPTVISLTGSVCERHKVIFCLVFNIDNPHVNIGMMEGVNYYLTLCNEAAKLL
jgi:hypothetical protein